MAVSSFTYSVENFGQEKEPVIIMDNFSEKLDLLLSHGKSQYYTPASAYYPGLQATGDKNYLSLRRVELPEIMSSVFGLSHGLDIESCMYAVVNRPPEKLAIGQRLPHYDGHEPTLFALLHYIQGDKDAGTAFYRHRRTGFETITKARAESYRRGLEADNDEFGVPKAQYFYGNDPRYEMIGEVKARPDRAIIYRGQSLHSGCIPNGTTDNITLKTARITLNTFLWDRPS